MVWSTDDSFISCFTLEFAKITTLVLVANAGVLYTAFAGLNGFAIFIVLTCWCIGWWTFSNNVFSAALYNAMGNVATSITS